MSGLIPEIAAAGRNPRAAPLNLSGVAAVEVSVHFHDGRSIEVARHSYAEADEDAAAIVLREIAASKLHADAQAPR
jgi:hypothetical protein